MNPIVATLLISPFVGAVLAYIAGRKRDIYAFIISEITGFVLLISTLFLFITYKGAIDIPIEWFKFGDFAIPFGIYIDKLSLVMLLIATGLGLLDIHFSHDYMADDPHQPRYYAKVLFFIGGMILLVSAKELVPMFVGWEFMGLASYLLISFWHQRKAPADAGVSAFLFTRFGDIFLFAAIGILYYTAGTLDMVKLNHMASAGSIDKDLIFIVSIFIFIAAIGKSGQFPLFPWLMRAMEGPTTVSALIHGATMVNSGIYIVARLFDFYAVGDALIVVASVGALSAFIGATSALVQSEMKKVLAYSTMSHLSIAFVGLGVGSLTAGMTHLVNHAVFKALLFLSAGAVMISAHHTKDLWRLGGLGKKLPILALFMGMGVLSLAGIPPFSGFYSKDAVIANAFTNPHSSGVIALLLLIAGLLSMAYGGRLWSLIFAGKARDENIHKEIKPLSKFWILLPLGIMAVATLIMGFFQDSIAQAVGGKDLEIPHIEGLLPFMLIMIAILAYLVWFYYVKRLDLTEKLASQPLISVIHKLLFNGYYIEYLILWVSRNFIVESIAKGINWSDRKIVDGAINATLPISKIISSIFALSRAKKSGENAGMMALGLLLLAVALIFGGAS